LEGAVPACQSEGIGGGERWSLVCARSAGSRHASGDAHTGTFRWGSGVVPVDSRWFRLPAFLLAAQPARDAVEKALSGRDAGALRSLLAEGACDPVLAPLLTAIAMHFEGADEESRIAIERACATSALCLPALFVIASVAAEQRRLRDAMRAINRVQQLADEQRTARSEEILELAAWYAFAVEELAEQTVPASLASEPLRRAGPTCYLVSYPRSGGTMVRNALRHIFQAPWYSIFPGDGCFFSRRLYDRQDRSVAVIKDHIYQGCYVGDRVVYLIRDGRDAAVSLCRFLELGNNMQVENDESFAAFLTATDDNYLFGCWAANVRRAFAARAAGAEVFFSRYEEFLTDPEEYFRIADFVAPGLAGNRDPTQVLRRVESGKTALTGPEWSFGNEDVPELFKTWSRRRGLSNWRTVFGPASRKVFHEQGGTDLLIQLGYESDPDWWRNG